MKKKYLQPESATNVMQVKSCVALSAEDQTVGNVNPPEEEIDAGDALIHMRTN